MFSAALLLNYDILTIQKDSRGVDLLAVGVAIYILICFQFFVKVVEVNMKEK